MRSLAIVGMGLVLSAAGMGAANAAPVDLLCKTDGVETHLSIDVDAAKVVWAGQTYDATITDTEVRWTGPLPSGNEANVETIFASFDRDSGTLLTNVSQNRVTWACAKAQKIL